MGFCTVSGGTKAEKAQNKEIDDSMRNSMRDEAKVMKILLLGTGESGKSTIFKQMKIIHQSGYNKDDREKFCVTIRRNCIQNSKDLIAGFNKVGLEVPEDLKSSVDLIVSANVTDPLSPTLCQAITKMWKSSSFQEAYTRRCEFQLSDSTAYYLDQLEKIANESYSPTDQDILRSRVRTSGVVETSFQIDGIIFRMFDVGGQRSERRKWIHCFDNVQAVLFVVAMSEYDQKLAEDDSQNRIKEALSLFADICNSRFFEQTSIILFLNKKDIFEQKMQTVDLSVCFPEYTGGKDYQAGVQFLTDQFSSLNKQTEKQVYVHVTCATDTNNIEFVFEAVKDIIITQNLKGSGFI
eukprot:c19463_g1_i1.p1 GENE.c19463_g1_i1~~c19463_g1_i1.p1  ORF type:complete len:351 (+),score=82.04 c19463_g1_i1:34-1086(+)